MIDLMEIYNWLSRRFANMYQREHTKRLIKFAEELAKKYDAKYFLEEMYYEGYEVFIAFEEKKELQDELFLREYGDKDNKTDKEIEKLYFNSLFYGLDKMKVELYYANLNNHLVKTNMQMPTKEEIEKGEEEDEKNG